MFDVSWGELFLVGVVALIAIGPKDLPYALRMVGQWVAKARALAREFQGHVDDLMRESQVDEMKREFNQMARPPELDGLEDELMAGHSKAAKKPEPEAPPVETDKPLAEPPAP